MRWLLKLHLNILLLSDKCMLCAYRFQIFRRIRIILNNYSPNLSGLENRFVRSRGSSLFRGVVVIVEDARKPMVCPERKNYLIRKIDIDF